MRRVFQERGHYVLVARMDQIRKSKQDMMAKNRYFQVVLDEYSKLVNPAAIEQPKPLTGEAEAS